MSNTEKDRLDLRQEFERLFNNKRIAEIAMEAMPPIDYSQLATKTDLASLDARLTGDLRQLRGEFAQLRGEFAELKGMMSGMKGELHQLNASSVRMMVAGQIVTIGVLGAWITAVT